MTISSAISSGAPRGDGELAAAAAGGDRDAFGELYRRHAPGVRAAIRDNVVDPHDQLDVLQETFTRALAKIARLHDRGRFRPWVLQIARNAAVDHRRHRRSITFEGFDEQPHPVPVSDPSPESVAEMRELADRVSLGLTRLSPRDAAIVALAAEHDLGTAELAIAMRLTPGNAKVVLHRARRALRATLEMDRVVAPRSCA